MSSDTPSDIPPPDSMHLSSATGWIQLGNTAEALADLEKISETHRAHFEVLHLEWHIHAQKKDWDRCVELGGYMVERHPTNPAGWINQANALFYLKRGHDAFQMLEPVAEHFPENEAIPYNLACYACQFGDLELALDWYRVAEKVGEPEKIQEVALMDPDMELLWEQIRD